MTVSLRKSLQLAPLVDSMRRWGNGLPVNDLPVSLESDLAGTGDEGGGLRAGRVPAKDLAGRGVLGRGLRDRGGPKGRIACSRFEVDCGPD